MEHTVWVLSFVYWYIYNRIKYTNTRVDVELIGYFYLGLSFIKCVMLMYILLPCSVEFIGYYLDRNNRLKSMKQQLSTLLEENAKLVDDQQKAQAKYDEVW